MPAASRILWGVVLSVWFLLAGCTQLPAQPASGSQVASGRTNLEALGGLFELPLQPGDAQSRLVIYQTGPDKLAGATGVFVDGTYHASVSHGAWSQLCYKPGHVNLGARQMQVGVQAKDLLDSITAMHLVGGQTHFLRVMQDNARPVLKPVTQAQALREMQGARQQLHTISRVAQECSRAPEVATPQVAVSEPQAMTAHVLFEFDKAGLQDMTPASLQLLDAQLLHWRNGAFQPKQLHVVGHADPLGHPAQNERLAQQRALTVSDYLKTRLPETVQVTAESRGANEPLVSECAKVPNARSIACNALNRRVVVQVLGASR